MLSNQYMGNNSAVEISGDYFINKFFKNLTSIYIKQPDFFTNYFLRLGDYNKFVKIVKQAIEESTGEKEKKIRKINDRKFLNDSILQLSGITPRYGLVLSEYVTSAFLDEEIKFDDPKIKNTGVYKREISPEKLKEKFNTINNVDIIETEFEPYSEDETPGYMIIESNKFTREVVFDYMRNTMAKAFENANWNNNKDYSAHTTYLQILDWYEYWLDNKSHEKAEETMNKSFEDFRNICLEFGILFGNEYTSGDLNEISDDIKDSLNKVKSKFKKAFVDKKDFKKLKEIVDKIIKTRYQGKSFPVFPGKVNHETVTLLPPSFSKGGLEIDLNKYLVRIFGDGWSSNETLELLLSLDHYVDKISFDDSIISSLIIRLKKAIKLFFETLGFDNSVVNIDKYLELITLFDRSGDPKRLYNLLNPLIKSNPNYHLTNIKDGNGKDKLNIQSKPSEFIRSQKVLFIANDYEKSREISEGYTNLFYKNRSVIPEVTLSLLTNSGIWPEKVETHILYLNMKINGDQKWNKSRNKSMLRWIKSTIDGIILYKLMEGEIFVNFTHPFSLESDSDYLLILPLFHRFSITKTKSNAHKYYYEIFETLIALSEISLDQNIEGSEIPFTKLNIKQRRSEKNQFSELLHNYIKHNLSKNNDKNNISNRFNLQCFDNIKSIRDFDVDYETILNSNLTNDNFNSLIKKFNDITEQSFERVLCYEKVSEVTTTINIPDKLHFVPYRPKNGNFRSIPELFFLLKLLKLGKTRNKLLSDKVLLINDADFDILIDEYFEDEDILDTAPKLVGGFVRPDFIFGSLLNASSSLRRTEQVDLDLSINGINIETNLVDSNQDFLTILFESHPISSQDSGTYENLFRVLVIHFTGAIQPKYIMNEYFLNNKYKDTSDYQDFVIQILFKIIAETDKYAFSRVKNSSRSGEYYARTYDTTVSEGAWRHFSHLSLQYIEKLKEKSKTEIPKIWGYIPQFMAIPQINFRKNTDPRLVQFTLETGISKGDVINPKPPKLLKSHVMMLIKPQSKGFETLDGKDKDRDDEAELKVKGIYATANAIINFRSENVDFSAEQLQEIKNLITIASVLGDELGQISLTGFNRLFYHPHSDTERKLMSPSLLIKGVDFFEYKEK